MIPTELNITLDRALTMNPELKKVYETDEQVKELIDMSKRLEGLPRHTSMHAAGVVISQKSIDEYVPLSLGSDNSPVTQFTMTTLEELGTSEMDFLGLRTLTVNSECRAAGGGQVRGNLSTWRRSTTTTRRFSTPCAADARTGCSSWKVPG